MNQTAIAKPQVKPAPRLTPLFSKTLKIIPIGGIGEIGKNMTVYEYDRDIFVVDCGIMFPGKEMLGIDYIIPDSSYLEANKDRVRGFILTHGHEDHVGGLPYIWPKVPVPVYTAALTAGMVKAKAAEFGVAPDLRIVKPGDLIQLGVFKVNFFHLAHSIPDTLGLAIETPEGLFLHITDWKFEHTPLQGRPTDASAIARFGERGVKLLLSDSTNIEQPGYSPSEQVVAQALDQIFKGKKGRIIFTSFASLINRIQQVFDMAKKYNRKVAVSGRSMEKNIEIASKLGFLSLPKDLMVPIDAVGKLPDREVVIITTGSQGEEYSALVRMAAGEHRHIKIKEGDTVIISASPIPGNEPDIHETIDNLFREGATVIYGKSFDIHTSGHAGEEELKMLIALARPEYFMPIHGEFRHLVLHGRLAASLGIPKEKIIVAENGQVVEWTKGEGRIAPRHVPAGYVLVDGLGVGDVGDIVLRDRQAMAKDGIFVVILTVDHQSGQILTSPDIISRGFVYMRAWEDLIKKARLEVKRIFARHSSQYPLDWEALKRLIREELSEFLFKETQRRPMVIPVIIEI